jgi:hypothetical protein
MRTKALLLGAAIGAISLATSMAQVYSVNIVGYVNTPLYNGWNLICNPLNASGGNTLVNVIPNPPHQLDIYKYQGGSYQFSTWDEEFLEWSAPNMTVEPGAALFIKNYRTNITWTFVGEVPTGSQTLNIRTGYNMISSIIPKSGRLSTDLGYDPSHGVGNSDTVYKYVNNQAGGGGYQSFVYDGEFEEWSPEPTINVGEGFWLLRSGAAIPWTQTFNVGS